MISDAKISLFLRVDWKLYFELRQPKLIEYNFLVTKNRFI